MKQVNTLKNYISKEDPTFQNLIIDVINNRSNLKFLLALSDYGRNIQKNINSVVADGKFNQALIHIALDQKNKGVFESPTPLNGRFKVANKFDIQNPVLGNLLPQINAII